MKSVRRYLASLPPPVGKRLFFIGWLLFLVSFSLPALQIHPGCGTDEPSLYSGWECAYFLYWALPRIHITIYDFNAFLSALALYGCAAGNLGALIAPVFLKRNLRPQIVRWRTTFFGVAALCALYQYVALFFGYGAGYFVWTASFGMLAAGSLILASQKTPKHAPGQAGAEYHPRTPEEMAAEQELKEYLRLHEV